MGGEGEDSGSGMGREWTNLNCDGVDGAFKLRSSSQIALDIDARWDDKKIKIKIILWLL